MRRGFTLIETILALALLSVVAGGAWLFFGTSSRQSLQLGGYVSTLEATALLQAALSADLLAILVPADPASLASAVEVGPDGTSLAFLRSPHLRDLAGETLAPRRIPVRWSARPGPTGLVLVREASGEPTMEFERAPLGGLRFGTRVADRRLFVEVEAVVLEDETSGGTGKAHLPLRLLQPLVPPLEPPAFARPAWPARLLGPPAMAALAPGHPTDGELEEVPDEDEGEEGDDDASP